MSGDRGAEFAHALEAASRGIRDPVAKLRYIRHSLARYQAVDRAVSTIVPWAPARRLVYRWLSLESLHLLVSSSSPYGAAVVDPPTSRAMQLARVAAVAGAMVLVGLAASAAYFSVRPGRAVEAPLLAASAALPPVAESLPPLPAGVKPARVWVVEKGEGWEQLSNGLRIDSTFGVAGDPRRYRTFDPSGALRDAVHDRPVGILFHTSESDIWPLEEANNEKLRDSSHRLLRYVRRLRLYNYLVDRFGRVFRVVDEEGKANHAGHSVWSREGEIFLNLNNAFLAVCFETRWEGGRALPITAAQLAAGRSLTEYLRQRWEIAGDLCVTHGLTSVNPKKHLIGHHVDWARGFPFEAFGLPDQYSRPAPSVAVFGFGYDDEFLKALGEPWAGVREAERALADEAVRQGRSLDEVRRERQSLYDRWHQEQSRDEEAIASGRAENTPARGALGG